MSPKSSTRIELELHNAIHLVLQSVNLRLKGIEHNLYYLVGGPGTGKTMMINELTTKAGGKCLCYSPALERLEKFGGIPDLKWYKKENNEELRTIWSIPQMISEINDASETHPFVVVLLDDWHLCIDELQQIGFELFTYYSLNGHKVNNNVIFTLAGNETSAAGAKVQLSAIRNRSTMIYTQPDIDFWLDNFAMPHRLHPSGVSFFKNKSNSMYFQEEESTSDQFGSPRSWSSAFRLIEQTEKDPHFNKSKSLTSVIYAIMQGSVSRAAAEKFMIHYEIFKKIDIEKIFKHGIVEVPTDNVDRFCFCSAVNNQYYNLFCMSKKKSAEAERAAFSKIYGDCISKLESDYPELSIMMVRDIGKIVENKNDNATVAGSEILRYLIQTKHLPDSTIARLVDISKLLGGADK